MIFNGAIEAAKEKGLRIATGTYTGSNSNGTSNPTKISCPFLPRFLFIYTVGNSTYDQTYTDFAIGNVSAGVLTGRLLDRGINIGGQDGDNVSYCFAPKVSYESKTVKIVVNTGRVDLLSRAQMNGYKCTYAWIAIG